MAQRLLPTAHLGEQPRDWASRRPIGGWVQDSQHQRRPVSHHAQEAAGLLSGAGEQHDAHFTADARPTSLPFHHLRSGRLSHPRPSSGSYQYPQSESSSTIHQYAPSRPTSDSHHYEAIPQAAPGSAKLAKASTHEVSSVAVAARVSKTLSLHDKLGTTVICILLLCALPMIAVVAILACVWSLGPSNALWHWVIVSNNVASIVNTLAEVLKQCLTLQLGVVTAMLAALILEVSGTSLTNAVAISDARSTTTATSILTLMKAHLLHYPKPSLRSVVISCSLVAVFALFFCAQIVSILLISDLDLAILPGFPGTAQIAYGLKYDMIWGRPTGFGLGTSRMVQPAVSTWLLKPPAYPTFAEYHEAPFVADGVSDTGLTLRALLPYATRSQRQSLQSYNGPATVFDARVTCQAPRLSSLHLEAQHGFDEYGEGVILSGIIAATTATPRLYNHTDDSTISGVQGYDFPISFECYLPLMSDAYGDAIRMVSQQQWNVSLCPLKSPYFVVGLISEFQPYDPATPSADPALGWYSYDPRKGSAYLALNMTSSTMSVSTFYEDLSPAPNAVFSIMGHRGEWLDFGVSTPSVVYNLSATICYTAFMAASLDVNMSSGGIRTEPVPRASVETSNAIPSYSAIRSQLGQDSGASYAQRGVLELEKRDWIVPTFALENPYVDYLRNFAVMTPPQAQDLVGNGAGTNDPSWEGPVTQEPNVTTVLWLGTDGAGSGPRYMTANPYPIWLFQEIMATGGSMAFALQSMITILASSAYNDQMVNFDQVGEANETFFVTVNRPVGFTGLAIVLFMVMLHVVIVVLMLLTFLICTEHTMLGQTWHSMTQMLSPATQEILNEAPGTKDNDLKKLLKHSDSQVRLRYIEDLGRAVVVDLSASKASHGSV